MRFLGVMKRRMNQSAQTYSKLDETGSIGYKHSEHHRSSVENIALLRDSVTVSSIVKVRRSSQDILKWGEFICKILF